MRLEFWDPHTGKMHIPPQKIVEGSTTVIDIMLNPIKSGILFEM
jgi:hypothetical protein